MGECIQDGVTGVVVAPGDAEGFRAGLYGYLESPERRIAAGAAAREFARAAFDPSRQAQAYLDLFKRLRAAAPE